MNARRTIIRTLAATMGSGILAALAITGGTTHNGTAMTAVADEGPGYAVEDFSYPNADKILAEQHITLKHGNGHILLADCANGTDLLEVWSRINSKICFSITGSNGYLTLEIPAVFVIKGNTYSTEVDMTTGTEEKSFTVNKNTWTPVGESGDPQGRDFTLMEIRASK
ncbi:hypothetical protein AB0M57_13820 [Streptomyces sp. NPDC051597]|uniref:hypothetical protein n=1 Tax=Streptomyces sp. NPDC051597 TaxID=3155049 RepID=UPI003445D88F